MSADELRKDDPPTSFGVFKPVGHVVITFPKPADRDAAADALAREAIDAADLQRYDAGEMKRMVEQELKDATPLAAFGQEINFARLRGEQAERGYAWLVVRCPDDDPRKERIAAIAREHRAELAQRYGRLTIEELL